MQHSQVRQDEIPIINDGELRIQFDCDEATPMTRCATKKVRTNNMTKRITTTISHSCNDLDGTVNFVRMWLKGSIYDKKHSNSTTLNMAITETGAVSTGASSKESDLGRAYTSSCSYTIDMSIILST